MSKPKKRTAKHPIPLEERESGGWGRYFDSGGIPCRDDGKYGVHERRRDAEPVELIFISGRKKLPA